MPDEPKQPLPAGQCVVLKCPPSQCTCDLKVGGKFLCKLYLQPGQQATWEGPCPNKKSRFFHLTVTADT